VTYIFDVLFIERETALMRSKVLRRERHHF